MARQTFDYTHGDVGTKPGSLDFQKDGRPNAQHFDWFWYNTTQAIKGHANEFDRLDSNGDGVVDAADNADTLDGVHASDLVSKDGDQADYLSLTGGRPLRFSFNDLEVNQEVGGVSIKNSATGDIALNITESGNVDARGTLYESGERVATRNWASNFVDSTGDTITGQLTLNTSEPVSFPEPGVSLRQTVNGVSFYDENDVTDLLYVSKDGGVEIPEGNIVMNEGKGIVDYDGNSRIKVGTERTELLDDNGNVSIYTGEYNSTTLLANSNRKVQIQDQEDSKLKFAYENTDYGGKLRFNAVSQFNETISVNQNEAIRLNGQLHLESTGASSDGYGDVRVYQNSDGFVVFEGFDESAGEWDTKMALDVNNGDLQIAGDIETFASID